MSSGTNIVIFGKCSFRYRNAVLGTTFEKYLKNESYILVKPKLPDPELCSYVKTKLLKLLITYFQKLQSSQTNLDDNKQL